MEIPSVKQLEQLSQHELAILTIRIRQALINQR
jgi:hypothetical protein